jgi:nuclear GTP-binding protein
MGKGRNCPPEERKKIQKKNELALPERDLRGLGERLLSQANRRPSTATRLLGTVAQPTEPKNPVSELAALAVKARQAQAAYNGVQQELANANPDAHALNPEKEQSLRRFYTELKKVLDVSDVILEVVDVRDPMGCRLKNLEMSIESQYGDRKTIIIILNKCDLVPTEVVDLWTAYFQAQRRIVVPFSAADEGGSHGGKRLRSTKRNGCISTLFRILRSIGRGETRGEATGGGERKSITVGVIGYPNVGKSSVINALRRKNVVGVGNTPGFTTGNTEVDLRKDIKILDCPGVVMPGEDTGDVVLRNAVKIEQLADPMVAIRRLYERCDPEVLCSLYDVAHALSPEEFVRAVGVRRGRIRQGGLVDETETAKIILADWNDGRVGYYTVPPESGLLTNASVSSKRLAEASEFGDETVVLKTFSSSLTVDGLPTFKLLPRGKGPGKARKRGRQGEEGEEESEEELSDAEAEE